MAFKLTISLGKNKVGSIKIDRFTKGKRAALRTGLVRAGALLEEKIVRNLSGPSHTLFPGNANPYPGVVTNQLRGSVRFKLIGGGTGVIVGPGREVSDYAAVQELGSSTVPPRPYVGPAWKEKGEKALNEIANVLFGLVK